MPGFDFSKVVVLRIPAMPFRGKVGEHAIEELMSSPSIRESIYLASPTLLSQYDKLIQGKITSDKERGRINASLYKYLIRMMSRPTPFGLFAGCSTVQWGEETNLVIRKDAIVRKSRIDLALVYRLIREMEKFPKFRNLLRYYPNSTIHTIGQNIRYVTQMDPANSKKNCVLEIERSGEVDALLNGSHDGESIKGLFQHIRQVNTKTGDDNVLAFINECIDSQLFVSELDRSITGEAPITRLIKVLNREKSFAPHKDRLIRIEESLKGLDLSEVNTVSDYESIVDQFKSLSAGLKEQSWFHVEVSKWSTAELTLSTSIMNQLQECLTALHSLSRRWTNPDLEKFKEEFQKRYQEREVPLLEALDVDIGIGYPFPGSGPGEDHLAAGLNFRSSKGEQQTIDDFALFLNQLVAKGQKENLREISLEEFIKQPENNSLASGQYTLLFSLLGERNKENFILLKGINHYSSLNMIARFAENDAVIENLAKEIASKEVGLFPDCIVAEIVHCPDDRLGNVLRHVPVYTYEVPYLSASSLPSSQQIPLSDIMISVFENKILLRSKKHDKVIIPRLSNAHNHKNSKHPIYRLLCDLQFQDVERMLEFGWGPLKKMYTSLPRIVYKNVVVSEAAWFIPSAAVTIDETPGDAVMESVEKFRQKFDLPRQVLLVEGDNELLIDFENRIAVSAFLGIIRRKQGFYLKECLFGQPGCPVQDENGDAFANQFIASLEIKGTPFPERSKAIRSKLLNNVRRDFDVGSEWLYYKFYCSPIGSDFLLKEVISPIVERLKSDQLINEWFFIRYSDPDYHLRFRVRLTQEQHAGSVIAIVSELISAYLRNKPWRIQLDTYNREIERYGEDTIALAEAFFSADSESILSFLHLHEGPEEQKWKFSVLYLDKILSIFLPGEGEKMDYLVRVVDKFEGNLGSEKNRKIVREKTNSKYRTHRNDMIDLFLTRPYEETISGAVSRFTSIFTRTIADGNFQDLSRIKNGFLESLVHMSLNRLYLRCPHELEFLTYVMLFRHYKSLQGREKASQVVK